MTRLIDADALKEYIDAQKGRPFIGCTIGEALKIMTDEQPTVDAEPVRHGIWINRNLVADIATCSCCGDRWGSTSVMKYCPSCGAKMDAQEDEK